MLCTPLLHGFFYHPKLLGSCESTNKPTLDHFTKYGDATTVMHTIQRLWHRIKGSSMSNLRKPISALLSHLFSFPPYSHSILEPVIGKDVVYDKRLYSRQRQPFRLGLNPALEYRCKRCPELPIYKLWEMQALMLHLRTKYGLFSIFYFHRPAILLLLSSFIVLC